jgi:hypothetical protein
MDWPCFDFLIEARNYAQLPARSQPRLQLVNATKSRALIKALACATEISRAKFACA